MADIKEINAEQPSASVKAEKARPSKLDLAFAMDCTGSMGRYIQSAQQGIKNIVEEIVSKESADIQLALVEYRDHPPQDNSFVTRPHDFTKSVREMKAWLDACKASGGGDCPEAVADALHDVLKLSWRDDATKICVFIADAPPHGLMQHNDGFPNGCPSGLDPMEISNQMAEKGITIYMIGCEPAIQPYKTFFEGLAHVTGGQYVPLNHAHLLPPVIIGGAQEELSLQHLLEEISQEVQQEAQAFGVVDEEEVSTRVHQKLKSKGVRTKQMQMNQCELPEVGDISKVYSRCENMAAVRKEAASAAPPPASRGSKFGAMFGSMFGARSAAMTPPPPPPPGAAAGGGGGSGMDEYAVAEDTINQQQARRMVKKMVKKNKLSSK